MLSPDPQNRQFLDKSNMPQNKNIVIIKIFEDMKIPPFDVDSTKPSTEDDQHIDKILQTKGSEIKQPIGSKSIQLVSMLRESDKTKDEIMATLDITASRVPHLIRSARKQCSSGEAIERYVKSGVTTYRLSKAGHESGQ